MRTKKYKGVIFDLDGTTLNTIDDLTESVNEVLKQYEYPAHTQAEYKKKVGNGFYNLLEKSLPEEARIKDRVDEVFSVFVSVYERRYMDKTRPYEGIVEMLNILQGKQIQIGINSNKRDDYTKNLIQKHFGEISFVDIIGEREGVDRKPNPVSALEIAGKMNLSPKEILYVGDSSTDMQTGKNAGMDTAGVLWGFRDREELEANGAVYLIETPEQIIELF